MFNHHFIRKFESGKIKIHFQSVRRHLLNLVRLAFVMRIHDYTFQLSSQTSTKTEFFRITCQKQNQHRHTKISIKLDLFAIWSIKMACRRFISNYFVANNIKAARSLPILCARNYSTDREEITKPTHTGQVSGC